MATVVTPASRIRREQPVEVGRLGGGSRERHRLAGHVRAHGADRARTGGRRRGRPRRAGGTSWSCRSCRSPRRIVSERAGSPNTTADIGPIARAHGGDAGPGDVEVEPPLDDEAPPLPPDGLAAKSCPSASPRAHRRTARPGSTSRESKATSETRCSPRLGSASRARRGRPRTAARGEGLSPRPSVPGRRGCRDPGSFRGRRRRAADGPAARPGWRGAGSRDGRSPENTGAAATPP